MGAGVRASAAATRPLMRWSWAARCIANTKFAAHRGVAGGGEATGLHAIPQCIRTWIRSNCRTIGVASVAKRWRWRCRFTAEVGPGGRLHPPIARTNTPETNRARFSANFELLPWQSDEPETATVTRTTRFSRSLPCVWPIFHIARIWATP